MPHPFHYFVPGVTPEVFAPGNVPKPDELRKANLGHLAGHVKSVSIQHAQIDGVSGAFFTPNLPGGKMAEVVVWKGDGSQGWYKSTKVWIGWEAANQPTPELLARKEIVSGYTVTDEAGRKWEVPIARSPNGRQTIPNDLIWDEETGEPTRHRKQSFDWLWDLSGEVWDYVNNPDRPADPAWLQKTALRILQVNYVIGPIELNAFRAMGGCVIDELRAVAIGMALIDNEIAEEVYSASHDGKKND